MPEGRIDDIVNQPEVSKQLDQLYERLQKVVQLIRLINTEGGKINLNRGLSESTIAAQQAKAATEELKKAKADLQLQEQAVKLAAQQAAAATQAQLAHEKETTQTQINNVKVLSAWDKAASQEKIARLKEEATLKAATDKEAARIYANTQRAVIEAEKAAARARKEAAAAVAAQQKAAQEAIAAQQKAAIATANRQQKANLQAQVAQQRATQAAAQAQLTQQKVAATAAAAAAAQQKAAQEAAHKATVNNSKQQEAAAKAALAQTKAQIAATNANKKAVVNVAGSLDDMRANLKALTKQYDALGTSARNAQAGMNMRDQIKQLRDEVYQLEHETGRDNRNVGNYPIAQEAVGGVESLLGTLGIAAGATAIFQSNYEVSDQLGDLQRIMGLTSGEADKLADSLKKLDTRTSLSGLLNIASIAAKAGVAKEDIAGVTKAIDQLVVVLGSELGDADQVTESLVKLVNIFSKDGRVTGQALSSIGNAILGLANAGVASGPFLVDYAQRLAGIAKTANFALSAALGLGAGFEELGQSAEVAGTATQTILSKIATDVPKFAKVAGKSIEEFTKTLRERPAEAIIEVSEALVKGKKGFDDIASAAADVEAKGRVSAVLGTIGANADKFRQKIQLAGEALNDTANIAAQFEIKNNTLAGSVDKLKNAIFNLTTDPNSSIGKFFKALIDGATKALYAIDLLSQKVKNGLSGYDSQDITPENISKLAKGKNISQFNEVFQAAIASKKTDQDNLIDIFSKKTKEEQLAEINDLKQALKDSQSAYTRNAHDFGTLAPVTIGTAIGIQGFNYRIKKSTDIYNGVGQKDIDTTPGEESAAAKKKREAEERKAQRAAEQGARARERELQAQADADKFDLNTEIEAQKEILDNEKLGLSARLEANDKYYNLKTELAEKDIAYQKQKVKQEIGIGKATNIELATLDKKLDYEKAANAREVGNNTYKIISDNADAQTKKVLAQNKKEKEELEKAQISELKQVQDFYTRSLISKQQYEDEKLRITNKYDLLELQADLDVQQHILETLKQRGLPVEDQEAKILEIRNKLRDADLKYFDDTEKNKTEREKAEASKREELRKKEIEGIKQLAKESVNALFSIFEAQFDNQRNAVQDQIDLLDKNTAKEIEAVDKSTDSAQNKADKIAVINARAAAQKDTLERRQRQIEQEKARFERLRNIGQIIGGTAVNIVKVFPNPVLIALAAAVGAAQLAQVLATPIPKYRQGTKNHPGGPAIVNDGGKLEVLESPTGKAFVAQGVNAMVDLPAHYKVHTGLAEYFKATGSNSYAPVPTTDRGVMELRAITAEMAEGYRRQTAQLLQGMAANKTVVNVNSTWAGLSVNAQNISGRIDYLNGNVFN